VSSKKTVFYRSSYTHGVDAKRRLSIPAKWRCPDENGEEELTLMHWKKSADQNGCLLALTNERMQQLIAKLQTLPWSDPKGEALRRLLGTASDEVTVDKAGRICLPDGLAKKAGITNEAVLVGCLDSFQIWSPESYETASATDEAMRPDAYTMV
jgi:MraZ protein